MSTATFPPWTPIPIFRAVGRAEVETQSSESEAAVPVFSTLASGVMVQRFKGGLGFGCLCPDVEQN